MSSENNKKDINSQIDDILNEIKQSRAESEPENADGEEFVDISSFGAESAKTAEPKKAEKSEQSAPQLEIEMKNGGESSADGGDSRQTEADKIISELPSMKGEAEAPAVKDEYHAPTEIKEQKEKTKKKGKKGFVAAGVAAALVLLGCSFYAAYALNPEVVPAAAPIPQVNDAPENVNEFVFAKGISIAGTDIGGKNQKEAKSLVKIKESDFKEQFELNVKYDGGKKLTFTQDDFTYTYNTDEVFEQAVQYSRDVSTAIQNGTLDTLAVPEGYNVTADAEKGTVDFAVSCIVGDSSIDKVVKRSAGKIDKPAVEPHATKYNPDAKSFKQMFTWEEGSNGTIVDRDALKADIKELFKNGAKSGEVTVETTTEKPKHNMNEVQNSVQLIGKFSTVSTNTYNATCNMGTALSAINGTIVNPGEVFSFNECTGDSNLESNGYLPASVIQNEEYVTGIGGGICQAATTIYNATLLAGMGIEERANHFYTSIYVYGGLDATIDYPALDLKMKNLTDYQIFLHTWLDGVTLNCEVYGWQSPEWDEIRTESWCSWDDDDSFGFEAQRVYYKNNKEVKREDLPASVYSHKNGHATVAGDPGTESTKIKDPKKNLKM